MKIGGITIGQSPRVDLTPDILPLLGGVELLEAGGLDGLTRKEIEAFAPAKGDYVLVSRLKDGSSVTFAERHILPRLQECVDSLERQGVELIVFFCTGEFPDFRSKVPLYFPDKMLKGAVPSLAAGQKVVVLTPAREQLEQSSRKWEPCLEEIVSYAVSPYGPWEDLEKAARQVKEIDAGLIVMDCIGYTQKMKKLFCSQTGKRVVLSRTIMARMLSEIIDQGRG